MTSSSELILTRRVTQQECHWLGRDYEEGEVVHEFTGVTFGCITPSGVACSMLPGVNPFFELPSDAVIRAEELINRILDDTDGLTHSFLTTDLSSNDKIHMGVPGNSTHRCMRISFDIDFNGNDAQAADLIELLDEKLNLYYSKPVVRKWRFVEEKEAKKQKKKANSS